MIEIKTYWLDDFPTIEDVEEAFELVKANDIMVELRWCVPYSGVYGRTLNKETLEEFTPESYFEKVIPHCYGV